MAKVSMIIDVMTKGEKGLDSVSKKLNNMADAQKRLNRDISTKQYTKGSSIYNMNLHDSNYKRLKDIRDIIKNNIDIQKEQFSGGFAKDESLKKKYDGVVESLKLMDISGTKAVKTLTDLRNLSDIYGGKYTTAYRKVENQFFKDEGIDLDYKNIKNIEKSMQRETNLYTKYQERAIKADNELNGLEAKREQIGKKILANYANILFVISKRGLANSFKTLKNIGNIAKTLKTKILKSINSIAHVFKYMVLRMSFRALLKDWQTFFVDYAKVSDEFNKKFSELYSAVKRVSAAFVSAFAPVIQALTPILTMFSNAIYRVLDAISQLNAALFLGKDTYISAKDYMRDFADEMDNAKGSAGGLNKQLASFDTINKLTDNKGGGSSSLEDANKIFGDSPILESIKLFAKRVKEAWALNDLTPIGEELADKMKDIVEKGLEVFDENNFKDTILPKISGVRKGLTAFFKKINDEGTSYDFGKLAGSIANDIVLAITTFLDDDNGITWYNELGKSIGNFFKGMIDRIDFSKTGELIASLRNLSIKFYEGIVDAFSSPIVDNRTFGPVTFNGNFEDYLIGNESNLRKTYASRLADEITEMLILAANETDYETWAMNMIKGIDSALKVIIGYLQGELYNNIKKGNALADTASELKTTMGSIGLELGYILILGIFNALAFLGGIVSRAFSLTFDQNEQKWSNQFTRNADKLATDYTNEIEKVLSNDETGIKTKMFNALTDARILVDTESSNAKTSGKNWGENILAGIEAGLSSTSFLGAIGVATVKVANLIKNMFTSKGDENGGGMGISSPSKVFEKFGQYILEGLQNGLEGKLDGSSLLEKIQTMKDGVLNIKDELINNFGLVQDSLTPIFEAISDSFKTQLELMVSNLNITIRCIKSGLQNMVDAMNDIIDDYNSAAREVGGRTISYVGRVNLNTIPVPKLATGAVIPPNKPFMAVMGDQKSGTNIEAPLDTIKQALSEVMSNRLSREVVLEVDGREFGRAVLDLGNQEQRRVGTRFITQ